MAKWPYNTAAWRRLRLAKLARNPLCHGCATRGQTVSATVVDHIKAIAAGGDPFPPLDNLMSLCARCHNEKTNAVDRPDRRSSGRRLKGVGANGEPLDDPAWSRGGEDHGARSPLDRRWESDYYLVLGLYPFDGDV